MHSTDVESRTQW